MDSEVRTNPRAYGLSTLTAAAASPKLNRIVDQSFNPRTNEPLSVCSGTITASPGIRTMPSKPPDQKVEDASLLTTPPLARTTNTLPLSASRVGPPALRKYEFTVVPGTRRNDPWL